MTPSEITDADRFRYLSRVVHYLTDWDGDTTHISFPPLRGKRLDDEHMSQAFRRLIDEAMRANPDPCLPS